jgi:hypothetical protein
MNTSTRSALSLRVRWRIPGPRIKLNSISRIWGTSFPSFAFQYLLLNMQISSYGPANRQTIADFLVAATDPNARIPRAGFSNQPRTAPEFAEYFRKSPQGQANSAEIDEYLNRFVGNYDEKAAYIESARAEFAKGSGDAMWVFVTFSNIWHG